MKSLFMGFLTNPEGSDTFGRPVGLLVLNDGSLLFTEDGNHRIYQVQYSQNSNSTNMGSTILVNRITTLFNSFALYFSLSIISVII